MKDNPWLSFDIGHPATKALQCGARKGGSKYAQFNESAAADKKDFLGKLFTCRFWRERFGWLPRKSEVVSERRLHQDVRERLPTSEHIGHCLGILMWVSRERLAPAEWNSKETPAPQSSRQWLLAVWGQMLKTFSTCVKSQIVARLLIQAND